MAAKRYQEQLDEEIEAERAAHGKKPLKKVFERLTADNPKALVITADAGYKTPWICKQIFDSRRIPSLPCRRPMTRKGNLPWYAYVYAQSYGCILCPQDKVLSYAATNREGDREYKSNICQSCLARKRRIQNQQHTKTVTRPIRQEDPKRAQDVRHSPVGKATCARPAFADH